MTQRLTALGSPSVETRLWGTLRSIASDVAALLPTRHPHTLLLIGGYGRGEGGVELMDTVQRPHNNLDLLLVTHGMGRTARRRLAGKIETVLGLYREGLGAGIDLSVIERSTILTNSSAVMWHDMRKGHRLLLGSGDWIEDMAVEDQPSADDMHRLVRNRGSLLLINRALRQSGAPLNSRTAVRHRAKAVIGFGDALLFYKGRYHWSYLEKARRIQALPGLDMEFKALYLQATEFRLKPNYDRIPDVLDRPFSGPALDQLRTAYLDFEAARLGEDTRTLADLHAALTEHQARRRWTSIGAASRRVKEATLRSLRCGSPSQLLLRSHDERLSLSFPDLLFGIDGAANARAARSLHVAQGEAMSAYLESWRLAADHNFRLPVTQHTSRRAA